MGTLPILGLNVLLYVDTSGGVGSPNLQKLAQQKNITLTLTGDTVDASSKDAEGWKSFLPALASWTIDCDSLIIESDAALIAIEQSYMTRAAGMNVAISTPSSPTKFTGFVALKSLKYAANDTGIYTATCNLQGSGPLTEV